MPAGSPSASSAASRTPGTTAPATDAPATGQGATDAPATGEPVASPTDAPASEEPAVTPTPEPSGSAGASESPGIAGACSGSDGNRAFFESVARAVHWTVLCAVLPKGWFVSAGTYRLANGGKVVISYKGPGGATLTLSEGAFCAAADGCIGPGSELGDAALGPMAGTLVGLDSGDFAIVVDRGANPAWLLAAGGLDQAATSALGAALVAIGP